MPLAVSVFNASSQKQSKAAYAPARSQRTSGTPECVVYLLDHDGSLYPDIQRLLKSVALHSIIFKSPVEFLASARLDVPSCLILDVRFPGASGLDFQQRLARDGIQIPIVFVTAYGDVSITVRAMKAGAVDFLTKPCRDQDLLDAVTTAIERDRKRRGGTSCDANATEALCRAHRTPAAGHGTCHLGLVEQADRRQVGIERNDGQSTSWAANAKAEGALIARPGADG